MMNPQPTLSEPATGADPGAVPGPPGRYRWTICALLFFATTINYIDRQILGLLEPTLRGIIGWSDVEYGYIVTGFQGAYALGLLVFGRLIDRYGTKVGYAVSITLWSVAAMGHALVTSVFGFGVARFALGLGESGNFPAAIKAVAEWFPKKERALATGIFNSGANIGAVVAPLVVPWLTMTYGWYGAFLATGALGFVWLVFWLRVYARPERHPRLSAGELRYIDSDRDEAAPTRIPWAQLLGFRQTWAFVIAKFLTDPIWWFYLYWLPPFLHRSYGLTLTGLGLPLVAIYTMTSVGSVGGGWLSSRLIRRGWAINRSRKTVMLACALAVLPIVVASEVSSLWVAVLLIGLAAAAHQGWSANLFTTASDMFPKRAVGSVTGLGGMAGSVGGMLFAASAGWIIELTGSYLPLFIMAGSAYILALVIMHLIVPRMQPAQIDPGIAQPSGDAA
jgi:ACS family hexuronate transporter-like MFS transporter